MDDPNSAAVANAIQAGSNFWGRVQQIKENRFTKQRLGMEERKTTADVNTSEAALPGVKAASGLGQLNLTQAQKADFLQSHNPLDSAVPSFGQMTAKKFIESARPVTDADVKADNERQLGPELANRLYPNPKAVPGHVTFPAPTDAAHRKLFGIPDNATVDNWSMPQADFDKVAPQYQQALTAKAAEEFQKPFDEMSPEAKQSVIESYQKNAPPGVKISDAEAIAAFRGQQLRSGPLPNPTAMGLVPTSGEYDPMNPASLKLNLTAPIGGPGAGGALTPEQFKDFGEPLQKLISGNEELKLAQQKATHVANVISYADEHHPTVSSDKSLIMSYLKTIDPTVRVSEGTVTTVMDNMGLPDEVRNSINHVLTGSLFTPEHREWFKTAALQNLENARQTAASSIQSSLSIAHATGNPLASGVKLPPNVLPPGRGGQRGHGPGAGGSESSASGSSAPASESLKRFSSMEQANSAGLPPGTKVLIFDKASGKYRPAVNE